MSLLDLQENCYVSPCDTIQESSTATRWDRVFYLFSQREVEEERGGVVISAALRAAYPSSFPISSTFSLIPVPPLCPPPLLPVLPGAGKPCPTTAAGGLFLLSWLRDWNSQPYGIINFVYCGRACHLKTVPPWHAALPSICQRLLVGVYCLCLTYTLPLKAPPPLLTSPLLPLFFIFLHFHHHYFEV